MVCEEMWDPTPHFSSKSCEWEMETNRNFDGFFYRKTDNQNSKFGDQTAIAKESVSLEHFSINHLDNLGRI